MVKDLDPSSFYVNKLENDYNDYERLVDLSKNKSLSPDDLIFIYNQYGREDTDLARQIIDGSLGNNKRWLQDDYDSLETVEQKANFITAISNIKQHDYYEQLFRDGENMLLINDKEPLIKATDKTGILLTGFASFMLLNDEKFICHSIIASKYCNRNDISLEYNVLNYLPAQCFGNINVLDALLTVSPTILKSFDGRNNIQNPGFALFNEKMKDKKFQLELLKSYYTSYLALCMVDESMATDFDYMEKIIQNMFDKEVLKIFNDEFFVEDVPCDRSNKKLQFIKKISNNQANE